MGTDTFANGMSIACKEASGKSICCFPDVCFTPPETPVTPPGVPIPYPNTAMASDLADGSKDVKIKGGEVFLKDASKFSKTSGDEAGAAAKKGVVTSKNTGAAYFTSWSMDVKVEGKNVDRMLDMTTHNHASVPGNTSPWPFLDSVSGGGGGGDDSGASTEDPCASLKSELETKCSQHIKKTEKGTIKRKQTIDAMCADPQCAEARKCVMSFYRPSNCCDGKTAHHPIPAAEFLAPRKPGETRGKPAVGNYKVNKAPCFCAEGPDHDSREDAPPFRLMEHGRLGAEFTKERNKHLKDGKKYYYKDASALAAKTVEKVTGCDEECAQAQIDAGHEALGVKKNDELRKSPQKADAPETLPETSVPSVD